MRLQRTTVVRRARQWRGVDPMNEERKPAEVWPPSVFVREELNARGWNRVELSVQSGLKRGVIADFMQGGEISLEIAGALGRAFGTNADYWLNLQQSYYDAIHDEVQEWREAEGE